MSMARDHRKLLASIAAAKSDARKAAAAKRNKVETREESRKCFSHGPGCSNDQV